MDFNPILGREKIATDIAQILAHFQQNKGDITCKRGIYIYGAPGAGKTHFVMTLLKKLEYDIIKYDAGDIRNNPIIEAITKDHISDKSVVSMFHKKAKPICVCMDEIDGMNNGDKGGINSLIKLIRPKKTKKQKLEDITYNPIVCISNYHVDKKVKELMKVCHCFELRKPTHEQMQVLLQATMPRFAPNLVAQLLPYMQGDLRKLHELQRIYATHFDLLTPELIERVFKPTAYNDDTKIITQRLLTQQVRLEDHLSVMNETDRTIVALLFHENLPDMMTSLPALDQVGLYKQMLDNMCLADYIDRLTFQKQIWQFNEMSSLIKTMHCNKLFHEQMPTATHANKDIRFTKVLTKYSTEYNNTLFIHDLCQRLGMDKKDLFAFFLDLRLTLQDDSIQAFCDASDLTKLDLNRIYRYLDKYTNKNCKVGGADEVVIDEVPAVEDDDDDTA